MKRSKLLVEVDCEEVEIPRPSLEDGLVVSEDIVEVVRSFCRNWSDLLIASCVSWYEKYWDSLDLLGVSMAAIRGTVALPSCPRPLLLLGIDIQNIC